MVFLKDADKAPIGRRKRVAAQRLGGHPQGFDGGSQRQILSRRIQDAPECVKKDAEPRDGMADFGNLFQDP